jgi:rhodanese-related sulfurtransferase
VSDVPEVDVAEAARRLQSGALLVDVREPWEWEQQRIPEAILLPLAELPNRLDEIPTDREVLVHCRSGARSARAVAFLVAQGRSRVANVAGGIEAWSAAGLPVEVGPPRS